MPILRVFTRLSAGPSASASHTAEPIPPMTEASSTVTAAFMPFAAACMPSTSRGLMVLTFTTFASTPSAANSFAASSA